MTPEKIANEANILELLYHHYQASVPCVIAKNDGLNCFLMKNAGRTLRAELKEGFNINFLCKAIEKFTAMQINIAKNIEPLLSIGVPDWQLHKLAGIYEDTINTDSNFLSTDGLSIEEIHALKKLVTAITQLCGELDACGIPPTLVQPDFNDNNVLVHEATKKMTFIDLGEIVISHPFFSHLNFLSKLKAIYGVSESDEAYQLAMQASLETFNIYTSGSRLHQAFKMAQRLQYVYALLAYMRLMYATGAEPLMAYQPGKLAFIARALLTNLSTN